MARIKQRVGPVELAGFLRRFGDAHPNALVFADYAEEVAAGEHGVEGRKRVAKACRRLDRFISVLGWETWDRRWRRRWQPRHRWVPEGKRTPRDQPWRPSERERTEDVDRLRWPSQAWQHCCTRRHGEALAWKYLVLGQEIPKAPQRLARKAVYVRQMEAILDKAGFAGYSGVTG
jgi:hypothetical protein